MTQFLQVNGGERGETQVRRNVLDPGKQTMACGPNATCFGMALKLREVFTFFKGSLKRKKKKKNMGQRPDTAQSLRYLLSDTS